MDTVLLNKKFEQIGARIKFVAPPRRRFFSRSNLTLDIGSDRKGEYFEITPADTTEAELDVLSLDARDRHLLLLVREENVKSKFLCGHDERHWFVAGIPESAPVGTVNQAKEALKPIEVQQEQSRKRVRNKKRNRRKNEAFLRQGEWFFIPAPQMFVDEERVLTHEPLTRGNGGKPHWADYCYRTGGETVLVCDHHPNGISEKKYREILSRKPHAKNWNWQHMRRNPSVYVRGHIRHPDHKTITLDNWHKVVMNTENQSRAMQNVVFLD